MPNDHEDAPVLPKYLTEMIRCFQEMKNDIYRQYSQLVDMVVDDELTNIVEIERIMDGLLDFCDDERFIGIYKKLCRHIYYQYPQLVGEHVALFRMQFEETENTEIF